MKRGNHIQRKDYKGKPKKKERKKKKKEEEEEKQQKTTHTHNENLPEQEFETKLAASAL